MPHQPIAVDYVIDGPHTGSAVSRGTSTVIGVAISDGTEPRFFPVGDAREVLSRYGDQPRVYHDAALAKCVELRYQLPQAGRLRRRAAGVEAAR